MRLKNLNLFEKYIEKVVLALGAVYAVVVIWFFVLGSPHSVEIRALHGEFKPGQVEEAILKEANDLDSRISSRISPFPDILEVPQYTNEFRDRLTRPLIPVDRFATLFSKPGVQIATIDPGPIRHFFVPQPPAPTALIWDTGFGVLSEPQSPQLTSEFEQIIGNQKPRDFRWVSVSAQFNMKRWRGLLSKQPPSDKQQLPKTWWQRRLIVTDVVLQRQVQDPETSKWGEIQSLSTVPGNDQFDFLNNTVFSFRSERNNWAPPEADKAIAIARIEQKRLPRPLFPELSEGLWLPPDANSQTLPLQMVDDVRSLVRQIEDVQKQIKDMKTKITEGGAPIAPPPSGLDGADGAGSPIVLDLPFLEAQRSKFREELYILLGIIEPIETLRTEKKPRRPSILNQKSQTVAQAKKENESSTPNTLRVWQHDVSVKDGQSVRYRMIVSLLNPLFFQSQAPKEQQEKYYQKLTLSSAPSAWTEPVQVLSEHHFFLAGVNKASKSTAVEVYCIFNGQWQRREFDVKPGDPIGQVVQFQHGDGQINVNMNVGGVVVDIDFDAPSAESSTKRTTRLIYFDGKTNTLQTRTLEQDQLDPKRSDLRKRLKAN
ncbi:hypothetical protein JYU15_00060 [bacterium AH-315-I18]|nr:hypothetical protein [bacterium AH-315-I18]